MSREEDLLKRVYAGFNSRDIDGVRRHWTRQWQTIDPPVGGSNPSSSTNLND
jgi:hypothetical protein